MESTLWRLFSRDVGGETSKELPSLVGKVQRCLLTAAGGLWPLSHSRHDTLYPRPHRTSLLSASVCLSLNIEDVVQSVFALETLKDGAEGDICRGPGGIEDPRCLEDPKGLGN